MKSEEIFNKEHAEYVNGNASESFAVTPSDTIFNKKFVIEKEDERDERLTKIKECNEKFNKEKETLQDEYEAKKLIQTAKADEEYMGKYFFIPSKNIYGNIIYVTLNDDGEVHKIFFKSFNANPHIDLNFLLKDFMPTYNTIYMPCSENDMEFVSEEVFNHEFDKYKKKVMKFMERHIGNISFNQANYSDILESRAILSNEMLTYMKKNYITDEDVMKYAKYLVRKNRNDLHYSKPPKDIYSLDD